MGQDFSALLHYPGPEASEAVIRALEQDSLPAMKRVLQMQREWGHATNDQYERAVWIERWYDGPVPRPALPNPRVALYTLEDFFLNFGHDAVWVYHPLPWRLFLTEPEDWQPVMLGACDALARQLGADEYVVTQDQSPVMTGFYDGASYHEAIARALAEGEPEVERLMDMYVDIEGSWDTTGFWRVRVDAPNAGE